MALLMGEQKVAGYGVNGKSAYDYAREAGFTGTVEEFASLMNTIGHIMTEEDIQKIVVNEAIDAKKLGSIDAARYALTEDIAAIKVDEANHADNATEAANATTFANKSLKNLMDDVQASKVADSAHADTANNSLNLGGIEASLYALKSEIRTDEQIKAIKVTNADNADTVGGATLSEIKSASDFTNYDLSSVVDTKIENAIDAIPVINDATNTIKGKVQLSDSILGTETAALGATAATPKAVSDAIADVKQFVEDKAYQNESQVKATKVNMAADTEKLGGKVASSFYDSTQVDGKIAEAIGKIPNATKDIIGKVKLSDATNEVLVGVSSYTAATPKAVNDALVAAKGYTDSSVGAIPTATDKLVGKVKLSDAVAGTEDAATGQTAVTPKALKAVADTANTNIQKLFNNIEYATETGILTLTAVDGSTKTVDLPLELLIESGSYNSKTQKIELVLANGSKIEVDAKDLVDVYKADGTTLTLDEETNTFKVTDGYVAGVKVTNATNADKAADSDKLGAKEANLYALKTDVPGIKVNEAGNATTLENKSVATIISEVPQATNLATGTVKLSDATAGTENAATGLTAATPKAVADALAAAKADTADKIGKIPPINDGTNSVKGKVKLSDATAGTEVAATGATAATPKAVADALTAAKAYVDGKGYQTNAQVVATKVNNATNADQLGNTAAASYFYQRGGQTDGQFDRTGSMPVHTTRLNYDGHFYATKVYGAVYNDYAETRRIAKAVEPGYIVEDIQGNNAKDYVEFCSHDMSENAYVVSDTFGFLIGDEKSAQYDVVPLGISGRVLVYVDDISSQLAVGDKVCSTINGKVRKMTIEEAKANPFAVIGIVSSIPEYEAWGTATVNNRVWIKIK